MKTLHELRRLASLNIQMIAQTRAQLSDTDARTYLDYITVGVHALRKGLEGLNGKCPECQTPQECIAANYAQCTYKERATGRSVFVITDGKRYFFEEGTFQTRCIDERMYAK